MIENNGIWIAGGTVTADAMAAGHGAVANSSTGANAAPTLDDLRGMVHDLVQTVIANAAELDDPEQTVTVSRLAEQESAKEAPDKKRLAGLLQLVAAGAGAVSGLAAAVEAVERAVHSVL